MLEHKLRGWTARKGRQDRKVGGQLLSAMAALQCLSQGKAANHGDPNPFRSLRPLREASTVLAGYENCQPAAHFLVCRTA
jgi:hypothetical protein